MSDRVRIELQPLGKTLEVARGTPLQDVLFEHGVEFPCGGHGRCKGCRVKVLAGELSANDAQREILSEEELADGWRLACRCVAENDLTLEIAQWEAKILSDEHHFEFTPSEGLGVAVDLGTTTLVAQLVDLETGNVLAVQSALNPQARYGADIMSRVQHAIEPGGLDKLSNIIRKEIGTLIGRLLSDDGHNGKRLCRVALVGNTVMHHLFAGVDCAALSAYPFETPHLDRFATTAGQLGWPGQADAGVHFLPCLGGFVGSDILAGVVATEMHKSEQIVGLVDLGTNGEIVIGHGQKMLTASTAAGPAFEGAKISSGMRAATGAISEVHLEDGRLHCHVLGQVEPRGICGSGLVDAVAAWLALKGIDYTGRLADCEQLPLCDSIALNQKDIRELQLAKGAIAAGFVLLREMWGDAELDQLYLAGAFGNYINRTSARRIGLLDFPDERITPAGNTALLGAKLALFMEVNELDFTDLRARIEHVSLSTHHKFQDVFADSMYFPTE